MVPFQHLLVASELGIPNPDCLIIRARRETTPAFVLVADGVDGRGVTSTRPYMNPVGEGKNPDRFVFRR